MRQPEPQSPPLLIRDVRVLGAEPDAPAQALVCEAGVIAWLGPAAQAPDVATVFDARGALLGPAFVDAHVHCTATGLVLTGLDLSAATSGPDLLDRVAAAARPGEVLLGHGWDESQWPERSRPGLAELTRATGGGSAYLSRTDLHSALSTPDLLGEVEHDEGWVRLAAHHTVRARALAAVSAGQARDAQRATRAEAARLGIASLHEMSGPEVASAEDLRGLLELAGAEPGPGIVPYWGALGDHDGAAALGAQPGGDLFVDGSFGSHTAALHEPYADDASTGSLRYAAEELEAHVLVATERGQQAGFHCIGDRAIDTVLDALERVAARLGTDRVAAARHRLEHLELPDGAAVVRTARLGVVASVQPAFDARWAEGMYVERLGGQRAAETNPFAALEAAGVSLALGSDAPVTPLDPWGTIRAAIASRHPISLAAALRAHTVGGAHAARDARPGAGTLTLGAPADLAVWEPPGTGRQGLRAALLAGWSPRCLLTVVGGRMV